jgi:nucleoside-diphosphate-sugar epimerase
MSSQHHIVVGAGPVGMTTALLLAEHGHQVTVASRSGAAHGNSATDRGSARGRGAVTHARLDVNDPAALTELARGATALYNCVNPPYHRWATDWPPMHRSFIHAAESSGAVLVMMDNLYGFGADAPMPMREGDALRATGVKGAMRATMATELLEAHASGRLRATLARASDFFGPRVTESTMGERVVPKVIAGKKVSLLGELDVAHHSTYMPDVARTLVTIAADERAWGKPWHVPSGPAVTQRQMVEAFAHAADTAAKVGSIPWPVVRALGLAMPFMRELRETRYQFDRPWIVDATLTEQTFGLCATPLAEAAAETVAWWRAQHLG